MKAEFEIKITRKAMYRFLMYHAYHSFSGIFSIVAGAALLIYYGINRGNGGNTWLYLLFGVLFLVYQPWTLYLNAVKQVGLNPVFKKPLLYRVSREGIEVCQEESANQIGWDKVQKIRESAGSIFVYTGKKNAFIWIRSQMGDQEETVRRLMRECGPKNRPRQKKRDGK